MIYTLGYAKLTPDRLCEIVTGLDADLIDVRYKPVSRKPGFGGNQLRNRVGAHYVGLGHFLGGGGHTTAEGIECLEALNRQPRPVILMCLEESPGECHRHTAICGPHFPEAVHIFRDELVRAQDLTDHIRDETQDYPLHGYLSDLLGETAAEEDEHR